MVFKYDCPVCDNTPNKLPEKPVGVTGKIMVRYNHLIETMNARYKHNRNCKLCIDDVECLIDLSLLEEVESATRLYLIELNEAGIL